MMKLQGLIMKQYLLIKKLHVLLINDEAACSDDGAACIDDDAACTNGESTQFDNEAAGNVEVGFCSSLFLKKYLLSVFLISFIVAWPAVGSEFDGIVLI
jgi:hypothetical protein